MRQILSSISLLAAGVLAGCGGSAVMESSVPATAEQHGGVLVPLTDNEAYAEILNGDRAMKKGKATETTLVVYLLQPDLKSAYAQAPTSVEVTIGTSKGDQKVALKASPDAADPLGSTRFVSAPGPFELNQVGGEVAVQVGGKTLSGKFRGPR